MPTYVQPVSFSAQSLIAPDVVVQQQQNERQQQLAAALRNMSFEPIEANGGNISWTQGMAKLAQALAGRVVQNRADKQAVTINQAMVNRINGSKLYGYNDPSPSAGTPAPTPSPISLPSAGTGLPPTVRQVPAGSPTQLGGAASQVDPLAALPDTSSQAATPPQQAPAGPQGAPQPPMPPQGDSMPPMAPPSAQQQPGAFHPGPLTLTGNPARDRMLSVMYPDEFGKGIIANAAPVEMARTVQQAQEAMARGDTATAIALLGKVQHDNNIPLETTRPGGLAFDRMTGTWHYTPTLGAGQTPTLDAHGNVTSVSVIPGATDAIREVNAAEARGKAKGGADYDFVTLKDATGREYQVPKSALVGGNGQGGSPAPAPAGRGPGQIDHMFNNPPGGAPAAVPPGAPRGAVGMSGLGPGDIKANEAQGTNSANGYNDIISAGSKAQVTENTLRRIQDLGKGLNTGPGTGLLAQGEGIADRLWRGATGQPEPVDSRVSRVQEITKLVNDLARQGGFGTDYQLQQSLRALPDVEKAPQALNDINNWFIGRAQSDQSKALAAGRYQQANGSNSLPQFQIEWQRASDPRIFQWNAQGPDVVKRNLQQLDKTDPLTATVLRGKYQKLKAMGAF